MHINESKLYPKDFSKVKPFVWRLVLRSSPVEVAYNSSSQVKAL